MKTNRNDGRQALRMPARVHGTVLGALLIALAPMPTAGQESMRDIMGSTYREKMVFAIYDFPSLEVQPAEIERIALNSIRLYARDASVRHGIPPALPYPAHPSRMQLQEQGGGRPRTVCTGELFSLSGVDASNARAGEITGHRACLFPYARGFRLNYFAIYGQQSGIGNSNPNVAAAMAGRALANLFGIGDASKFIEKILDRMESGFKDAGIAYRLVQLHPANMEGRTVVADDLPLQQPVQAVAASHVPATAAPAQPQPMPVQQAVAGVLAATPPPQNLPPELEKFRQTMNEQREMARQQLGQKGTQTSFSPEQASQITARKELHAMGFQYFNRDQFLDAIRRGDRLVVELFVSAGGIGLSDADHNQQTPLRVAEAAGKSDIVVFLREKGAK